MTNRIALDGALKTLLNRTLKNAPAPTTGVHVESVRLIQRDDEKRWAFYWLSQVETMDGKIVVDSYGHIIREHTLEDAEQHFMMLHRTAGVQHEDFDGIGCVIGSWITTRRWQACMRASGYQCLMPVGWMLKTYVQDDATWEDVKADVLPDMSLGGYGSLKDVQVDEGQLTSQA